MKRSMFAEIFRPTRHEQRSISLRCLGRAFAHVDLLLQFGSENAAGEWRVLQDQPNWGAMAQMRKPETKIIRIHKRRGVKSSAA